MARKRSSGSSPAGDDGTDGADTTHRSQAATDDVAFDLERTAVQLWSILRTPQFAWGLVALLAVPAFLFFGGEPAVDETPAALPSPVTVAGARVQIAELPEAPLEPRGRVVLLLQRYEQALRDRDLEELREYWAMSPQQEKDMADLFRDARIVSPLVDLQQVEPVDDERMRIAFAQVLTLVRGAGQFYARGPTVFRAEVVRAPGFDAWMLRDVEEVAAGKAAASVTRESAP